VSLDLKHLRCFVAVAEELNFSAAARRLYVSQQALSRVVQQLERELGTTLLERTTRSVRLTPAGQVLLDSARRSLAAVDATFDAVRRAGSDGASPQLRVDVSSSGLQTGAEILRRIRRQRPDIAVREVEEGVPRGLVALGEARLDALFGQATDVPPAVHAEPVRHERVLLGVAADHPLAELDAVPVARLAAVELLLPAEAAPEWVRFVEDFCRRAGVAARHWPGTTHGSVGAAEVVGSGLCVVPTTAWSVPPPTMVFRPLVDPTPVFTWSMMLASDAMDRPELVALARCVRELSRELGWLDDPPRGEENTHGDPARHHDPRRAR
jgi:DNA-binding transcriptional LysR family regulator